MNSTLKRPLFIIGLQKSGTTLLNRLLTEQSDNFFSPFKLEGREFWGDDPPFTPTASPCGEIYQKHQGMHGHQVTEDDFDINHQKLLHQRISQVNIDAPILINKNPYNTVRIPWLKKMFPDCKIVAMVRNPYANIFSLMKKHIPHEGRGLGPEAGWWGVKPKNWKKNANMSLILKLAYQWREINRYIIKYSNQLDMVIDYKNLCDNPAYFVKHILSMYNINTHNLNISKLQSMDHEYLNGSLLLSKNRLYRKTNNLTIDDSQCSGETIQPLKLRQRILLYMYCSRHYNTLKELTKV